MPEYKPKTILEQQLRKGGKQGAYWPWRLLVFAIIIFGMTVFIYTGMVFGYQTYLERETETLDKRVADLNQQIESDQTKSLITLYSQVINLKNLLKSHFWPSEILVLLEQSTDNRVYYTGADFDARSNDLKLDGVASDYNALIRQMEIFRKHPDVTDVLLDDAGKRDQSSIQFSLNLILADSLIKR